MTSEITELWASNIDQKAAKERATRVLNEIDKYQPRAKSVLELGVGLGVVLQHFKKYDCYGLDLGKEYINKAKKLLPKANLSVQSMHNFKLNKQFDVIYSVHECINEIKPYKNWEATIKQAKKHLKPEGIFIFDMRTTKHLQDMKKTTVKLEETPTGYIYDNTIVKGNTLTWDTTYFKKTKNGLYKIEKDTYEEIIYPITKVKNTLKKHFKIININYYENKRKIMFTCKNKK